MEAKSIQLQLDLFPEIGIEGKWLLFPYSFRDINTHVLAFCRNGRFNDHFRLLVEASLENEG